MLATIGAGAALAVLQGCGLSSITSGLGGGLMGGSASKGSSAKSVSEESLLSAAKSDGDNASNLLATAGGCPQLLISSRDKHLTTYEGGRSGDGLAIIHQGEITKIARECDFGEGAITVRYGFSGRVLLGPRGQPGLVQLPVQMFLTDAARERVQTETMRVDVIIPPDSPIGYFSTVRTITFKVPEGARPADYKLFVGFDKNAPGEPAAPAAKTAKPAAKKG
jgi:hypothetical protein